MRKIKLLFLPLILFGIINSINAQSQSNEFSLPKKVELSFNKLFPNSKIYNVSVKKDEGKFFYTIDTYNQNMKISVTLNSDGKTILLSKQIDINELPSSVINTLKKRFKSYNIALAFKVTGIKDEYQIWLFMGAKEFEVIIKPNGKIISSRQLFDKPEEGC